MHVSGQGALIRHAEWPNNNRFETKELRLHAAGMKML
jgi:hypothetical protein